MCRRLRLAIMLLGAAAAAVAGAPHASAAITFESRDAARRFAAYVAFLERDPAEYASELATVRQLERSEVEYAVTIGGDFDWGVEGALTTDGERVLISLVEGDDDELMSTNSRIAHELEHARQFDDGEIAFERDPESGRWSAHRASYDIGDEVKAWQAQLRVSVGSDLWKRREGNAFARPTLLSEFASARTDVGRAEVLAERGYGSLRRMMDCHVAFSREAGYAARQLVRPDRGRNFFGRVRTTV